MKRRPAVSSAGGAARAALKTEGEAAWKGRKDEAGVVGMGDHMPSFIEKSFEERLVN